MTDAVATGKIASSPVWRVVRRIIKTVDVELVCICYWAMSGGLR